MGFASLYPSYGASAACDLAGRPETGEPRGGLNGYAVRYRFRHRFLSLSLSNPNYDYDNDNDNELWSAQHDLDAVAPALAPVGQ
jgi:hypothetical protein